MPQLPGGKDLRGRSIPLQRRDGHQQGRDTGLLDRQDLADPQCRGRGRGGHGGESRHHPPQTSRAGARAIRTQVPRNLQQHPQPGVRPGCRVPGDPRLQRGGAGRCTGTREAKSSTAASSSFFPRRSGRGISPRCCDERRPPGPADPQGRPHLFVDMWISPAEYPGRQALLVTTSDITKRLEAEQQLIQASKMATLGEMATGVAHELNQPLAVIKTASRFFIKKTRRQRAHRRRHSVHHVRGDRQPRRPGHQDHQSHARVRPQNRPETGRRIPQRGAEQDPSRFSASS